MWTNTHIYNWKLGPGFVLLAKACPWLDLTFPLLMNLWLPCSSRAYVVNVGHGPLQLLQVGLDLASWSTVAWKERQSGSSHIYFGKLLTKVVVTLFPLAHLAVTVTVLALAPWDHNNVQGASTPIATVIVVELALAPWLWPCPRS